MATQSLVLRSQVVIEEAVRKNNLADLESFKTMEPVGAIMQGISVSRDTKETQGAQNNIMVVGFRCGVADDCPKVITAVTNAYKDFLDNKLLVTELRVRELMTQARIAVEKTMKESETKQLEFIKAHSDILISRVQTETASALEKQFNDQEIKITDLKAMIARLDKAISEGHGIDQVPLQYTQGGTGKEKDNLRLKSIEDPLIAQEMALLEKSQYFGKGHPEIKSKELVLEAMRKKLEKIAPPGDDELAKRYRQGLLTDLQNAIGLKEAITGPRTAAKGALLKFAEMDAEEKSIVAEVTRNRQLFDGLVTKIQQLDLGKRDDGFDAHILSRPGVGFKVLPNMFLDLGAGVVIGLLLGAGLAYLADASDKSFRGPDEIRRRLGLPLVGHIPHFKPEAELARRRDAGEATIDPMLVTHLRPKSINAESYRAVRTSLFFSTQGQGHRVIQVTSPNKGDGKSLLCSNLAITIAQSGKRVLLIDADCRRPRQHKVFNVPHDVGLASVLLGQTMAHEAVQKTTIPGLDMMPCGPIPPNPSELLVSPRFKEVLEMFRAEYDFVLVDTPPVLAVTDPCVVAGKVDGLVVAIRLTRKGRPDAERAKEILMQVGANVFGVVVNGVTQTSTGVYSAQAYDYTYDYEDEDPKNHEYYTEDEETDVATAAS